MVEKVLNVYYFVEIFPNMHHVETVALLIRTTARSPDNRGFFSYAAGLIKLTQAMGGGKTHNMLALGLLAAHPEYRERIMKDASTYKQLGKVKVVAFTGRESDAPLGI